MTSELLNQLDGMVLHYITVLATLYVVLPNLRYILSALLGALMGGFAHLFIRVVNK